MRRSTNQPESERTDICRNCEHYCSHFICDRESGQFVEINYGHCIFPRNKIRTQSDSCEHFAKRQDE